MDYYHEIDFPSLFARAVESDDDVGTTLRIHLLCERMVEHGYAHAVTAKISLEEIKTNI